MDEESRDNYDVSDIEAAIRQFLQNATGATYNQINGWALVVQATSNDGTGDMKYGGLFTPPGQDMFANAGLRWLFDEGLKRS